MRRVAPLALLPLALLLACRAADKATDTARDPADDTGEPVDADGDGWPAAEDCDDDNPAVHPGAPEWDCADPVDYNCDGSVGYDDADGDGAPACQDCDDDDAAVNPDAAEVCDGADNDCDGQVDVDATDARRFHGDADADGFGGSTFEALACEPPAGFVDNADDCDDLDASSFPGGTETCDDADNDCDGTVDEDVQTTFYVDGDRDGYGDADTTRLACAAPVGFVDNALDCDDANPATSPASYEVCDGIDNDCDGAADDSSAINTSTFYLDSDGDGYGARATTAQGCEAPSGYVDNAGDCDDADSGVSPAAAEVCDSVDNDCDGSTDEADATDAGTWYADADADGYGDPAVTTVSCSAPSGMVADDSDCDDTSAAVSPAEPEVCNGGVDDDCDGDADDDDTSVDLTTGTTWYADADGDGYGDASATTFACDAPSGYADNALDCNDADATRTTTCADGTSQASAGITCATILAEVPASADGTYWVDPDGDGDTTDAFEAHCDMTGGGWTYAAAGTPFRLDHTGATQTLVTPNTTTTVLFTAHGAAAGRGYNTFGSSCGSGSATGGLGGMAEGSAAFAASTTLYVEVGGQGDDGGCADQGAYHTRAGGYNGGGRATQGGSGGGGATDVRTTSGDLSSRLLVAGGGGGCGSESCIYGGGHGGGLTGGTSASGASGGTQTAGGSGGSSTGSFGLGGDNVQGNDEGGGGGGWYGGAAGGGANAAGSGGSSYHGGMTASQSTTAGANAGDGYLEYIYQ